MRGQGPRQGLAAQGSHPRAGTTQVLLLAGLK